MGKESGGDSAEVLGEAFFKERKAELEQRVSKKRFTHVMGVVEEAEILARAYGVDVREARLAGLLHDWDKAYDDEEIRERVRELGLQVNPWILEHQPRLLHGPTAAAAAPRGREYSHFSRHPAGTESHHGRSIWRRLDMVIYRADALETEPDAWAR